MTRLAGSVVAVTRDGDPDDRLVALLEARGARTVVWPTLRVERPVDAGPLLRAAARIDQYDWVVFTSSRAVDALTELVPREKATPRAAAVGPSTAAAAEAAGWNVVVTGDLGAHALARRLLEAHDLDGAAALFPAASLAGEALEEALTDAGARVDRVEAYTTVLHPPPADDVRRDLSDGVDFVAFASPSAARALAQALGGSLEELCTSTQVVAIGPTTEEALRELGAGHVLVASPPALEGLVEACATSLETTGR